MNWRPGASGACLMLGLASTASASENPTPTPVDEGRDRIVLVGTVQDHGLIGRIAAELRAAHLDEDLRLVETDRTGVEREIDRAMHGEARVVFHADASIGQVDIWLVDRASHPIALRMSLNGAPLVAVEQVLALRAVELVRASLLGRHMAVPAPPPESQPERPPPSVTMSAALSSGLALAQGGLGVQGELGVQLRLEVRRAFGLNLMALAPVTETSVPGMATTDANASVWLAGADGFVKRRLARRLTFEGGLGGLAVAMRVAGDPNAGWMGGTKTRIGAGTYLRLGASVAFTRILALRADLLAGATLWRPVASAGGPTDEPWGYAFGLATVGIEATLF